VGFGCHVEQRRGGESCQVIQCGSSYSLYGHSQWIIPPALAVGDPMWLLIQFVWAFTVDNPAYVLYGDDCRGVVCCRRRSWGVWWRGRPTAEVN
jgi:hypothetical protein